MGTWGEKPFQSDSSLDWFDGIEGPVLAFIEDGLRRDGIDNWDVWYGAADLLLRLKGLTHGDSDEMRLAIERMRELVKRAPELEWKNKRLEREFVSSVKSVGRRLRAMQKAG